MVRAFDSDDIARAAGGVITLLEYVDCPACATTFDGVFTTLDMSVEDIDTAPAAVHRCPACGTEFGSTYTGWTSFGEPG